jgi:hypothetical protein
MQEHPIGGTFPHSIPYITQVQYCPESTPTMAPVCPGDPTYGYARRHFERLHALL